MVWGIPLKRSLQAGKMQFEIEEVLLHSPSYLPLKANQHALRSKGAGAGAFVQTLSSEGQYSLVEILKLPRWSWNAGNGGL